MSCDVESLLTNIAIKETTEFIYYEIYNHKKLKLICKQFIFKKLLFKIIT